MVQHIGLRTEKEGGVRIADFGRDGIPLEVLDLAPDDSVCLRFIDPYGDTVFNQLQLPVLIEEFEEIACRTASATLRARLNSVVSFLTACRGTHQYVRFLGD
jgi:hypothetical protein